MIAFKAVSTLIVTFLLSTSPARAEDLPTQDKYQPSLNAWFSGDLDQARALAEELVAADDRDALAHAILGQVMDGQGDEECDSHLEQALELGASDVAVLTRVADLYATRFGSYVNTELDYLAPDARRQAERLYQAWAAEDPASPLPLQRLAWLKKTAGDAHGSVGLLFVAISRDPMVDAPHGELWRFLGATLDYEQLASFYAGLAISSQAADAKGRCLNYQGQVLIALGKKLRYDASKQQSEADRLNKLGEAQDAYKRAIPLLEESALTDPSLEQAARWYVADSELSKAELYGEMGDLPAVSRLLEGVRAAITASAEPGTDGFKQMIDRLSFALFQASGGEGGSADGMQLLADLWKWALTQVDDDVEWWNNYAFFCRESQQYEQSYEAYNHCVELDPENVRYVNDTGLIQLYHLGTDLDRALGLFEKASDLGAAQYPELLDDEEAEAAMRSAYGDALLNLGILRSQRGEYDQADAAFDRLEELDADRMDLARSRIDMLMAINDTARLREFVHETALKMLTDPDNRWPRFRLRMLASAIEAKLSKDNPNADRVALLELTQKILEAGSRNTEDNGRTARRGRRQREN